MSIPIPAERIPPIAKEVADSKRTFAILWWFGSALALLIAFGKGSSNDLDRTSEIGGIAFWAVVLIWLGFRQWRIARRATEAARRAEDGRTTFVLASNHIIAIDERQIAQPVASFKISGKLQAMLTALPKAELRS